MKGENRMQVLKRARLLYSDLARGGRSDKEYRLSLASENAAFYCAASYGRRGATLTDGWLSAVGGFSKAPVALTEPEARRAFERKQAEKQSEGYVLDPEDVPPAPAAQVIPLQSSGLIDAGEPPCELLTEISEREAALLVESPYHIMQKKMNGQRRMLRRSADGTIVGINRKGLIRRPATSGSGRCPKAPFRFLPGGRGDHRRNRLPV
jgi:hypothetical protein